MVEHWMEVGFSMPNLDDRCEARRGSSPRPEKLEESVLGALLGLAAFCGTGAGTSRSIFGLYENREDMICFGARDGAGMEVLADAPSVRGRFFGRTSGSRSCPVDAEAVDVEGASFRALRFSTRFAFTLKASYSP